MPVVACGNDIETENRGIGETGKRREDAGSLLGPDPTAITLIDEKLSIVLAGQNRGRARNEAKDYCISCYIDDR